MAKQHNNGGKHIVAAHDQVRQLLEVIHYPDHPKRTESEEYKRNRAKLHAEGCKCYIDNGFCQGPIQIHHLIEWATANEVDWEKVKKDRGYDHVDDMKNLMPLCEKHHQWVGFGIHEITYPAWLLQKYMTKEALELFEKAVQHMKEQGHEDHHVNHASKKMLMHLHHAKKAHQHQ